MPACKWMMIRGCLRCIDGVSPNRVHVKCDTSNGPYATVPQMMDRVGQPWAFPDFGGAAGGAPLGFVPAEGPGGFFGPGGGFGSLGRGPLLLRDRISGEVVEVGPDELAQAVAQPSPFPYTPGPEMPFPVPPVHTFPEMPAGPVGPPFAVSAPGGLLLFAVGLAALAGAVLILRRMRA